MSFRFVPVCVLVVLVAAGCQKLPTADKPTESTQDSSPSTSVQSANQPKEIPAVEPDVVRQFGLAVRSQNPDPAQLNALRNELRKELKSGQSAQQPPAKDPMMERLLQEVASARQDVVAAKQEVVATKQAVDGIRVVIFCAVALLAAFLLNLLYKASSRKKSQVAPVNRGDVPTMRQRPQRMDSTPKTKNFLAKICRSLPAKFPDWTGG